MHIKEITPKSIITPSKLPNVNLVINPYVGCQHACVYCYACFMQRFGERQEAWGDFVDVKINADDLMDKNIKTLIKHPHQTVAIGSVTDAYQPLEAKYELTRKILKKLAPLDINLCIITKSSLITRDIDLLQQQRNCTVAISLSTLDDKINKLLEPHASSIASRFETLRKLYEAKINTVLFMSPILPKLTPWNDLVDMTQEFVHEYWFENLNLYPAIKQKIKTVLDKIDKRLWWDEYLKKYYGKNSDDYWYELKVQIIEYCKNRGIAYKVFFHS